MKSLFARRNFLSLLAALALLPAAGNTQAANPIPEENQVGGFAVGVQAYSFNRFTLFEAIEKTEQTGGKIIELYPKHKLSKERPNDFCNHDASDEVLNLVKEKLKKHGVRVVNYGVVTIPKDEAGARKVFEFAKKMGLYAITTESDDAIDMIEKMVKEYDIRVGFHEHAKRFKKGPDGQQVEDTNYKIWDPNYLAKLLKGRDSRIGACADIGHWQTSGIKAMDGLKILEGRIISLHMKDRGALGPSNHDMIFGTGITDIGAILGELRRQKFDGNIAIEYEYNWDNSVPDIAQCIGFVRGWGAANKK